MSGKTKRLSLDESFSIIQEPDALPDDYVLVTDRPNGGPLAGRSRKTVVLDYRPGYADDREGCPMPCPMFPAIYADGGDLRLEAHRAARRQWQVLF